MTYQRGIENPGVLFEMKAEYHEELGYSHIYWGANGETSEHWSRQQARQKAKAQKPHWELKLTYYSLHFWTNVEKFAWPAALQGSVSLLDF